MTKQFPLWQFETKKGTVLTRAKTLNQAKYFLSNFCGEKDIVPLDHCQINAAWQYSISHPFDWLNNSPLWMGEREIVPTDHNFKFNFFRHPLTNHTTKPKEIK